MFPTTPTDTETDLSESDGLSDLLRELPPRQAAFVRAYLTEPNGVRSALVAGYFGGEGALAVTASRLLRSAKISKILTVTRDRDCAAAVLSRGQRLALLSKIATADVGNQPPPSWSERTNAMALIAKMQGEIGPRLSLKVDLPNYIVPMPLKISDPDEWSKAALSVMQTIDAATERLPLA